MNKVQPWARTETLRRLTPVRVKEQALPVTDQVTLNRPDPPPPPPPPRRWLAKAFAITGLALTGLGVAAGLAAGVHGPAVVYACPGGGPVRVPGATLLERIRGEGQRPAMQAVLRCAGVTSADQLTDPGMRADYAWYGMLQLGGGEAVWPYGQKMAASLDRAKLSGDYTEFREMVRQLEDYRDPRGGYSPTTDGGSRYYDDNAWLGLVFVQAHAQTGDPAYLAKAEQILSFLQEGMTPEGGILWVENADDPTYNTCSLGPTIELSARLYNATQKQSYLDTAVRLDSFLDKNLLRPDGLYSDHVSTDFRQRNESIFSYNQGTPVGGKLLLYQATGNPKYLEDAQRTASAALELFGQNDRLWKQSPAFNAIMFRNLLQVPGVQAQAREQMDAYLTRAWTEAFDPANGTFSRSSSMGSYDDGQKLDQAGLIQLYALQKWPKSALSDVT